MKKRERRIGLGDTFSLSIQGDYPIINRDVLFKTTKDKCNSTRHTIGFAVSVSSVEKYMCVDFMTKPVGFAAPLPL